MGNVVHSTYTTGLSALPNIYARALGPAALGLVRICQAKHECLWYKYNIYYDLPSELEIKVVCVLWHQCKTL